MTVNMCLEKKTATTNKLSCMPPGSFPLCQERKKQFLSKMGIAVSYVSSNNASTCTQYEVNKNMYW